MGDCYKNSFDYVTKNRGWVLVHGIPLGTGGSAEGLRYGHAWVECDGVVYDPTVDVVLPKIIYYALGNIEYAVEYTVQQALDKVLEWEHYGPWDEVVCKAFHGD